MAQKRSGSGRIRRGPIGYPDRVLAASACTARLFNPNVEIPEGVICGVIKIEQPEPDGPLRVTSEATFVDPP